MKLSEAQRRQARTRATKRPTKPVKVYHLYRADGGYTPKTVTYNGEEVAVAATSLRQALAFAYKAVWVNPTDDYPLGVFSVYQRDHGTTLWCGCSGHELWIDPGHGKGVVALRAALATHRCAQSEKRS